MVVLLELVNQPEDEELGKKVDKLLLVDPVAYRA